eukprot:s5572_g5.t1
MFGEFVGARKSSRTSTNNAHVGLRIVEHFTHVAPGHLSANRALTDGRELHGIELRELVGDISWVGRHSSDKRGLRPHSGKAQEASTPSHEHGRGGGPVPSQELP